MPAPVHQPAHPETVFTDGAPQLTFGASGSSIDDDVAGISRRSLPLW